MRLGHGQLELDAVGLLDQRKQLRELVAREGRRGHRGGRHQAGLLPGRRIAAATIEVFPLSLAVSSRCPRDCICMWSRRAHGAGKVAVRMTDVSYAMPLNRSAFLRRGVGGATLLATGSGLAAFAGRANAAGIPDGDLSYLRLLVGAELLKIDSA